MMKINPQSISKNVNKIIFDVWVTFALFVTTITTLLYIFLYKDLHVAVRFGMLFTIYVLPAVLVKDITLLFKKTVLSNILFFIVSIAPAIYFFEVGKATGTTIPGDPFASGYIMSFGVIVGLLSIPNYYVQKNWTGNLIARTTINVLGSMYCVLIITLFLKVVP